MNNHELIKAFNSLTEKNRKAEENARQRGLKKLSEGLNKKHKADLSSVLKKYAENPDKQDQKEENDKKENKEHDGIKGSD